MRLFGRTLPTVGVVVSLLGTGCGDERTPSIQTGADAATPAAVERSIQDLVAAVTPLPATASVGESNLWYGRQRALLERLRAGSPELGRAALAEFHRRKDGLVEVRIGLLDVAAHAATEETLPVLVELVTRYGEDLGLRTRACLFLGRVAPENAVEVLTPILEQVDRPKTYPPDDQMLEAWLDAMNTLGRDEAPLLARIATDFNHRLEVRIRATKALGSVDSDLGRDALKAVLVESSGNNYVRRIASQSLQKVLPGEDFCALVRGVQANEADTGFVLFLEDTLETYCR